MQTVGLTVRRSDKWSVDMELPKEGHELCMILHSNSLIEAMEHIRFTRMHRELATDFLDFCTISSICTIL